MITSEKLISVADGVDDHGGEAADAAWERLRREASTAIGDDDPPLARRRIGEALAHARRHLATGDPRLAASIAAEAWLQRGRAPDRAAVFFEEALAHWTQAEIWLAHQPPPERRARSSSFHLRLENRHPGAYRERRAAEMKALLADGRALTEALRDGERRLDADVDLSAAAPTADIETQGKMDTQGKIVSALALLLSCLR